MNKRLLFLILVVISILLVGCNSADNDSDKTIVAVTIVPQETFVKAVCGDLVDVVILVPPGSSPETYEPTLREIESFSKASIYFTIGMPTEEVNILPAHPKVKEVKLHEFVSKEYEDLSFDGEGRDSHIWLSPKRVVVMVRTIADEMSKLDPKNSEVYSSNAEKYISELEALDESIKEKLEDLSTRKFIVFHPAFGYFAADYDLTMYSLEEHGKEATPKHLEDMIELAKRENIKAIFYQSEIDSSQSRAFAEEIGGKTIMLNPLSKDYIRNLEDMANLIAEATNE